MTDKQILKAMRKEQRDLCLNQKQYAEYLNILPQNLNAYLCDMVADIVQICRI